MDGRIVQTLWIVQRIVRRKRPWFLGLDGLDGLDGLFPNLS